MCYPITWSRAWLPRRRPSQAGALCLCLPWPRLLVDLSLHHLTRILTDIHKCKLDYRPPCASHSLPFLPSSALPWQPCTLYASCCQPLATLAHQVIANLDMGRLSLELMRPTVNRDLDLILPPSTQLVRLALNANSVTALTGSQPSWRYHHVLVCVSCVYSEPAQCSAQRDR